MDKTQGIRMITKILYTLAIMGFYLSTWTLFNLFGSEPTNITPITHTFVYLTGFVGFTLFGLTMINMAQSFKNLERLEALP